MNPWILIAAGVCLLILVVLLFVLKGRKSSHKEAVPCVPDIPVSDVPDFAGFSQAGERTEKLQPDNQTVELSAENGAIYHETGSCFEIEYEITYMQTNETIS